MPRSVRLFVLGLLCSGLCGGSLGCNNEDPPALFVDIEYQVRCVDCNPRGPDGPERDLSIVNGEQDTSIECYGSANGSNSLLHMRFESDEYAFELDQVRLGADPGDQCRVEVKEGEGNTYRGGCKSVGSDDNAPCEVELRKEGDAVLGTVMCNGIQHSLTPEYKRYIVAPGTDDEPAEITILGCTGL